MGDVYDDIKAERARQDAKWGGPEHDDELPPEEWLEFIKSHVDDAEDCIGDGEDDSDARHRNALVEVAALAVAGIEYMDRHTAKGGR